MRLLRSLMSSTTSLRAAVCSALDAVVEGDFAWREERALGLIGSQVGSDCEEGSLDGDGKVGFVPGRREEFMLGPGSGLAIIAAPVKECCRGGICVERNECDAAGTATGAVTTEEVG